MIKINFGRSHYESYLYWMRPDEDSTPKDKIIIIPEKGDLKIIPREIIFSHEKDPKAWEQNLESPLNRLCIVFELPSDKMSSDEIILSMWVKEREEWIAILKRWWMETSFYSDERYDGPHALNEMCSRKILQAYGIPERKFTLEEVRRMSPERLKKNSQSPQ